MALCNNQCNIKGENPIYPGTCGNNSTNGCQGGHCMSNSEENNICTDSYQVNAFNKENHKNTPHYDYEGTQCTTKNCENGRLSDSSCSQCVGCQVYTQCRICEESCQVRCQNSCMAPGAGSQEPEKPEPGGGGGCGHCMSCQDCQSACQKRVQCTPTNQRPDDWIWQRCVIAGEELSEDQVKIITMKNKNIINDNIYEAFGKTVSNKYYTRAIGMYITAKEWNDFTDWINKFEVYSYHNSSKKTKFKQIPSPKPGGKKQSPYDLIGIDEIQKAYDAIMKITKGYPDKINEYCMVNGVKKDFPQQPDKNFDTPISGNKIRGVTFQDLQILLNNAKD